MSGYELSALLLLAFGAEGEVTPKPVNPTSQASSSDGQNKSWDFNLSISGYFFPNKSAYLQPTLSVDHEWLHLEGRYNNEALQTGSLWVGWNFHWGETLTFSLTPMVGWVFGQVNGAALGLEWSLAWGPVAFNSENEFVLTFADVQQSFFSTWSQLSINPFDWLSVGLALQRNRSHAVHREVYLAPFIGFSFWKIEVAGFWFDPGQVQVQYWVVSVSVSL